MCSSRHTTVTGVYVPGQLETALDSFHGEMVHTKRLWNVFEIFFDNILSLCCITLICIPAPALIVRIRRGQDKPHPADHGTLRTENSTYDGE